VVTSSYQAKRPSESTMSLSFGLRRRRGAAALAYRITGNNRNARVLFMVSGNSRRPWGVLANGRRWLPAA
jgi:hypothetical protein